jgi:serine phosphatase RsbU (regulator of sigma subunit)
VEGAAVYTREEKGSEVRLRFAHSSGVFWTMQVHADQTASKTSFITKDLQRESYALGDGVVGIAAKNMQPLELDRGHERTRMRELGLNPHNVRNVLAVPLNVKERILGVLVVQNRKHKSSFSADDIRLMRALTEQAAISINNVRMYEELAKSDRIRQEMNIATDIQRTLLPKTVPLSAHLKVHPFIRPAKEVGGDYYDFIESAEGHFAIVIGDVSGKGLPAGMIMVIARTTLQIVARGCLDAKEALTRFSREMYPRMRRGQFMTLNFLLWDDDLRTLRYAAAGHEHILWYRTDRGHSERIRAGGVAVGLLEDPSKFLSESTLQAHQGDVFVLYTDGITEARDKSEEMFTLRRLQESLDRHAALADAEKISASIIAEVTAFAGEAEQYDDMTLIVAVVE